MLPNYIHVLDWIENISLYAHIPDKWVIVSYIAIFCKSTSPFWTAIDREDLGHEAKKGTFLTRPHIRDLYQLDCIIFQRFSSCAFLFLCFAITVLLIMNNREIDTYYYLDYLFTVQPGDRWICDHLDQLKQSLQELELKGEWYDGLPSEEIMRRIRFTSSVVIHSMYDILSFRLEFIKNHLEVYKCNKGQMDT